MNQEGIDHIEELVRVNGGELAKNTWKAIRKEHGEVQKTAPNKQMDAIAFLRKIHNRLMGIKWRYSGKNSDEILDEVGTFLSQQQHH